jgi:hypothetical protein
MRVFSVSELVEESGWNNSKANEEFFDEYGTVFVSKKEYDQRVREAIEAVCSETETDMIKILIFGRLKL